MKYTFKTRLIAWIVALILWAGVFCLALFLHLDFSPRGLSDAFFVAGMSMVFCFLLYVIGRFGTFDILAYSFFRLWESFRADGAKRWDSYLTYQTDKKASREKKPIHYLPYLIIFVVSLIASVAFLIVNQTRGGW
jgi:hypothetical protein